MFIVLVPLSNYILHKTSLKDFSLASREKLRQSHFVRQVGLRLNPPSHSAMENISWWRRVRLWFAARRRRRRARSVTAGEALLKAAQRGDALAVQELLADGVLPDAHRTSSQKTALWLAALHGHREATAALLAAGADPVADDGLYLTPLVGAAVAGHHGIIELIAAVRPEAFTTESAAVALWRAALASKPQSVQALLKGGTPVDARGPHYPTALFAAAICDVTSLEVLLNAGANPDATDSWGRTALHHAAAAGRRDCAALLLTVGTDLLARDDGGFTAADVASTDEVHRLLIPVLPLGEHPLSGIDFS